MAILQMVPAVENNGKVRSPFRYPGGKFYAIKYLQKFWSRVLHDEYREPFVGGGQVFFAKPKVKFNWLNDIFEDLVNAYRMIQHQDYRQQLMEMLIKEQADKMRHSEMKQWNPKSRIEKAHRFYYLNRTSYSGIMHKPAWGYHPLNSAPPASWVRFIEGASEKLRGVKITSLDFAEVITAPARATNVFMYLDPPYIEADQTRAYSHPFTIHDHKRLADVLKTTRHKFLLSYDDCDLSRKLYSWANLHAQEWWYNTANISSGVRKKGKELLITNF